MKLWVYKDLEERRVKEKVGRLMLLATRSGISVRNADSCWHFGVGLEVVVTLRLCVDGDGMLWPAGPFPMRGGFLILWFVLCGACGGGMMMMMMGILYSNNTMDDDVWLSVLLRDDTQL